MSNEAMIPEDSRKLNEAKIAYAKAKHAHKESEHAVAWAAQRLADLLIAQEGK